MPILQKDARAGGFYSHWSTAAPVPATWSGDRFEYLLQTRISATSRLSSSLPRSPYIEYGSVGRSGRARDLPFEAAQDGPRTSGFRYAIQTDRRSLAARPGVAHPQR